MSAALGSGLVDSDAYVLARLRAGDERAFTELVECYHTRLRRFAYSFGARGELAEDIAQETWVALLRGIDRFEGRSSLRTWLFQICANRARSMAAREQRVVPVDPDRFGPDGGWPTQPWQNEQPEVVGPEQAVDPETEDTVLVDRIHGAMGRLADSQRQVVTLRDAQGMTSAQVCEILSISEANQRVLLHRGRARIRAVLSEEAA
jgi:RNA polymerase sigma-70 factor, ECF subfamily